MKFILFTFFALIYSNHLFAIDTKADHAIVFDWKTNEVLFEKNADNLIPPASMTKILTVYIVFDRIKNSSLTINDTCKVSARAYKKGGSRMFVEIDEYVTINDLLRGIIIQSGNDASIVIAECLSGTVENFSILMNQYANNIGMKNSNFLNASGWPDDNHYSTVRDIAILSNKLIKDFPDLYSYFNEKSFTYNNIRQPNRNQLLDNLDGADGLKTGYTKKSGWALAASAIKKNRRITVVVSGANSSRSRLNESINLINWAFRETEIKKILTKDQIIKDVDVWLGNKPKVQMIVSKDVSTILSYDQIKLMNTSIEYEKPIKAPINKNDKIGQMTIKFPGKKSLIIDLVAKNEVKKVNPLFKFFIAIRYLIFGTALDE